MCRAAPLPGSLLLLPCLLVVGLCLRRNFSPGLVAPRPAVSNLVPQKVSAVGQYYIPLLLIRRSGIARTIGRQDDISDRHCLADLR